MQARERDDKRSGKNDRKKRGSDEKPPPKNYAFFNQPAEEEIQ